MRESFALSLFMKPIFVHIILLLMLSTNLLKTQINLVPNYSNEGYYFCPNNHSMLDSSCISWFTPISKMKLIPTQTSYRVDNVVYTARIMINYNPDDYGVAFRFKPKSVEDVDKDAIKLYPNPAQDILNIEFENPTGEAISGSLKVFNLSGQLIFEKQLNTNNAFYMLDISSLTNGAYIFSIQINNNENTAYRHQSGKLIVLKP